MRAGFRHARDRVQRMDASTQLLRGLPWSVRYKLEQEMAESVGAPPFFFVRPGKAHYSQAAV